MEQNMMNIKPLLMAMGLTSAMSLQPATAAVNYFDWQGTFTFIDASGLVLADPGIPPKGNNQYQTPLSGTIAFDTLSGAGTASIVPFFYNNNPPSQPFEATSIELQAIGNGIGGPGTLVLGNMLFNWNGNVGIPVSMVWDASGFFTNGAVSAVPASDGSYVGVSVPGTGLGPGGEPGYLATGPVPIATTAWNTTNFCGTTCTGVSPSGVLPLIFDTASSYDYTANIGGSIGGSPMTAGPFIGNNINIDFTELTFTGSDPNASIYPNIIVCSPPPGGGSSSCPPQVPIPAAVWLFGSGLLTLVGFSRRRLVGD